MGYAPQQIHFNLSNAEFKQNFLELPTWKEIEPQSIIGTDQKNRINKAINHKDAAKELQKYSDFMEKQYNRTHRMTKNPYQIFEGTIVTFEDKAPRHTKIPQAYMKGPLVVTELNANKNQVKMNICLQIENICVNSEM